MPEAAPIDDAPIEDPSKEIKRLRVALALSVLTDTLFCPLCRYDGFWSVDPKTGRDAERDERARILVEKIEKIFNG